MVKESTVAVSGTEDSSILSLIGMLLSPLPCHSAKRPSVKRAASASASQPFTKKEKPEIGKCF